MITLKYSEIGNFQFAQAMQKISSTPTHGSRASLFHKANKQLQKWRERISKEYQDDIVGKFGKRDEKGEIIRPEGEPNGFEPIEDKMDEFLKAQEDFGKREVHLNFQPFTLDILSDIKLSAQDLEALQKLYVGNWEEGAEAATEGPGVPSKVASIR